MKLKPVPIIPELYDQFLALENNQRYVFKIDPDGDMPSGHISATRSDYMLMINICFTGNASHSMRAKIIDNIAYIHNIWITDVDCTQVNDVTDLTAQDVAESIIYHSLSYLQFAY